MDFDLSKPQKLLQESVRDYLARQCPLERTRELMATETAFDDDLWRGLADQGWLGLILDEKFDGLGMSAVDLAAVCEAMGEFTLPGPFLSTLWGAAVLAGCDHREVAGWLRQVAAGERVVTVALLEESGDWGDEGVAAKVTRSATGLRLEGVKYLVGDAARADLLLWIARIEGDLAIVALPATAKGVRVDGRSVIDQTRKLYTVSAEDCLLEEKDVLAVGERAVEALRRGRELATVAVCAELVGGMQWQLAAAVEYAKSRSQFGKVIGSFQAVQHMCADMLLYTESARSATYNAAYQVAVGDRGASRAVSIAKAYCSDAARQVGNLAIQVHGGIGFTWEHDLHLFFKRAKSSEILLGDAGFHRRRIAADVIDGGAQQSEQASPCRVAS